MKTSAVNTRESFLRLLLLVLAATGALALRWGPGVLVLQAVVLLFSIVVHECMHAWTAERMGDPTARLLGRVTLNPLPHIDLFGTILIPLFLILTGSSFVFGWAKPVPVNPYNFRDPRKGILYTSLAGPASNLGLAVIAGFLFRIAAPLGMPPAVNNLLLIAVYINVILAVFNLLPIPPLDGSGVLSGFLPAGVSRHYLGVGRYGFLIIILLFSSGLLRPIFGLALKVAGSLLGI